MKRIAPLMLTISLLPVGTACAPVGRAAESGGLVKTAAYEITNVAVGRSATWTEANDQIMAAKRAREARDLGSMVRIYIRNEGEAASLKSISWGGKQVDEHAAGPDYQAIWWRLNPWQLEKGQEGEVAICLRRRLVEPTTFTIGLSNGAEILPVIEPGDPPLRIGSVGFATDLERVYLYVEKLSTNAPLPGQIYLDGHRLDSDVTWLSRDYVGGVIVAVLNPQSLLRRGEFHTFRVVTGEHVGAATLRAFTGLARFGVYGVPERLAAYAGNGLDNYSHFKEMTKGMLDHGQRLGIKIVGHLNGGSLPEGTTGHPALYAWHGLDEPDAHDHSAGKDRPVALRLGTLARKVIGAAQRHAAADPATPTMLTLNNTFLPQNYFVYGQVADITNSDLYPIVQSRSVREVPERIDMLKRASAPRFLMYTYQCMWQELSNPDGPKQFMGLDALREAQDVELYDRQRHRGFGRAPAAGEVRRMMLYGVGCGARALLGFTDSVHRAPGWVLSHGAWVLPEVWEVMGRTSRSLRLVAPLVEISHPMLWARGGGEDLWVRTLVAGNDAALVIVVNEDYISAKTFTQTPATNVKVTFRDLPWMKGHAIWKVSDGRFVTVLATRSTGALSWTVPKITDAEVYLVADDLTLAARLEERFAAEPPEASAQYTTRAEDYLNGRRATPPPEK